jgi:hypothetical protein
MSDPNRTAIEGCTIIINILVGLLRLLVSNLRILLPVKTIYRIHRKDHHRTLLSLRVEIEHDAPREERSATDLPKHVIHSYVE